MSGDDVLADDVFGSRGDFFRVLHETGRTQTAVMTIAPGGDAGPEEMHDADQIVYVIEGEARIRIEGAERRCGTGTVVTIPAGARHHVASAGSVPLFLLTVYAPPAY